MAHTAPPLVSHTRHAIILAAGESKRTRPLTLHRPKPLIPLVDRPLLAHILDELVGLVDVVTLVVGYRAAAIEAHFGAHYGSMQLRYVHQHERNGTAGALLVVAEQQPLDAPFYLLYGDNLVSQRDIAHTGEQRYCLAALPVDEPSAFGVLDTDGGQVRRIIEKPPNAPPGALANPGIYHFDAQVVAALRAIGPSPRGEYELTDLIAALAAQHPVGFHRCQGHWLPVGTPWDALAASVFVLRQRAHAPASIHPEAQVAPGCTVGAGVHVGRATLQTGCTVVGPAYIGDGATLHTGCTVVESVIGANAQVGAGSTIKQSVLGAGAQVGAGCTLHACLLDDDATLATGLVLAAQVFADVQPVAATNGLLTADELQQRGVVVGRGVHLAADTAPPPGSVIFPDAPATP